MNKLTYKEAEDLVIQAYFRNEILPLSSEFCFCGTLCENSMLWNYGQPDNTIFERYTKYEYKKMEQSLLARLHHDADHWLYEEELFNGMEDALGELRLIHMLRGEDVNYAPNLKKRQLA